MKSYIRPDSFDEFIEAYNDHINKEQVRNNNGLKSFLIVFSLFFWFLFYFFNITNIYFLGFNLVMSLGALVMRYKRID